ncbi:MAG TPA: hypothetical protein VEV81_08790, partial [Pyrinomonadaceae bacterium]|nr:hypothetical protein [Pyrinomonadaceae bacterium]
IEDSLNGVKAAKEAGMRCIAVPDAISRNDSRFELADVVLDSLNNIDDGVWSRLNAVEAGFSH